MKAVNGRAAPGEATAEAMQSAAPRPRDTSRDGLCNRIETAALTHFRPFWQYANRRPRLARLLNGLIVGRAMQHVPARPLALSTVAPYTTWPALTDRTWFARYLPPRDITDLPSVEAVAALFKVGPSGARASRRSTLLFPCFAQWFTDGFMMTDDQDRRRTRSSHQINLGQLYGMIPAATEALRLHSQELGRKGRLRSVIARNGEEWAPRLFDEAGNRDPAYSELPTPARMPPDLPADRKAALFAFGGERANSTPFTAMINVMFLREHNRLCGVLEGVNPDWDDERVFQTARNVNIVQLIKIVIEEYINHISPYWFRMLGDSSPCYKAAWNRPNWIPVEFNLLYRWHSLIPERVTWDGEMMPIAGLRFDNRSLLRDGLGAGFNSASSTKASQIGLFNTADFLLAAEQASVTQGRDNQLATYNDYREAMDYPRVTKFEQINGDPGVVEALRRIYGHVNQIEFFVGLFAEEPHPRAAVPGLIGRMVAADAFSHALTNPLLSPLVFGSKEAQEMTFSAQGIQSINATAKLQDLLVRNTLSFGKFATASMEQERADT